MTRTGITFLFLFILSVPAAVAQRDLSGSLNGYLYRLIESMPGRGTDEYTPPDEDDLALWEHLADSLLSGNYVATARLAGEVGYELVRFTDANSPFYILQKKESSSRYWGTYVLNPSPGACRRIVVQAPHPRYDLNTGQEGVYVFHRTGAFFLFLAGTHRCNSTYLSPCSGTTTVCSGSTEPYHLSDMAHNTGTVFQLLTRKLAVHDTSLLFLQLHGFAMRDDDPYVIMSNGTRLTPHPDPLDTLKKALKAVDPVLDFRVAHQDTDWDRLVAFNNVQGRYLNGSDDPCREDAAGVSGRFLHIEQEKSRLREDSTRWEKMAQALLRAFTSPSGISPPPFSGKVVVVPNPFRECAEIFVEGLPYHCYGYELYSLQGKRMQQQRPACCGCILLHRGHLRPGLYILHIYDKAGHTFRSKVVVE